MSPFKFLGASFLAAATIATTGRAGFDGQTILGPLGPGSSVTGNTTGHADDNDGWDSGDHIFNLWDGPDDVYQLNWPGGPMTLTLTYDDDPFTGVDLDFFLYTPDSLNSSGNYGITNVSPDVIVDPAAPAGTYYINVDGPAGDGSAYGLSVSAVPEPVTLGLAALAMPLLGRRRRG